MWKYLVIFFLSLALLLPAQSQAQGVKDYANRSNAFLGEIYLGLKYGEVSFALDSSDLPQDGSDVRNFGFIFGRKVNDILGWEVEYTYTASKDDIEFEKVFEETSGGIDYEIDFEFSDVSQETLGIFMVGKTSGDIYFKGRLGYVRNTQDLRFYRETNVYGVAFSVGGGVKFRELSSAIEFEYSRYPSERYNFAVTNPFTGTDFDDDKDVYTDMFSIAWVWSFE